LKADSTVEEKELRIVFLGKAGAVGEKGYALKPGGSRHILRDHFWPLGKGVASEGDVLSVLEERNLGTKERSKAAGETGLGRDASCV